MRRNVLAIIIMVIIILTIAMILLLLPPEPAHAEITAVTTDKVLYYSNEIMKIAVSTNSSQKMDNTTVRIEGIQDRYGKMRLTYEMPTNLSPGPDVFAYDYKLPSCSSCAGLNPGTYKINVTLVRNGAIISNITRSVQLEQ